MVDERRGFPGKEGNPGRPGVRGGGEGGTGGKGGEGGYGGEVNLDGVEKRIAALSASLRDHEVWANAKLETINVLLNKTVGAVEAHDKFCNTKTSQFTWAIGILVVMLGSLFGYIFYISGRQEMVLSTLNSHSERMIAIVGANVAREQQIRSDIRDFRELLRKSDDR